MSKPKIAVHDTLMTWPSLRVEVELLPWQWRLVPFIYRDWDCTSSCCFEWLMVKIQWFANRPLFSVERAEPAPDEGGKS